MSESFSAKAEVSLDVGRAIKAANNLVNAINRIQDSTDKSVPALNRMESSAVRIATSLSKINGDSALKAARSIRELSGALSGAYDATRGFQSNKGGVLPDLNSRIALIKQQAAEQKKIDDQITTYAQKANLDRNQQAQTARQQELAALKADIQARSAAEKAALSVRSEDARRANMAMLAQEQTARQQELAALRNSITERNRVVQQSSQAQVKYAAAASRSQLQYGQSLDEANNRMISQRYALYDVATTWGAVATATLGAAGAALKVAIDYESAFASVQRTSETSGQAAQDLKQQLVDLTTELPLTFANIAEIATLGGQLGIAAGGLEDFTRVVAMLTATTDLSAEAAGTALGRFQALLGVSSSEFDNVASSILKVGVNSVATETQITSIATQISSMGSFAGLTAEQVVGLSGALASVGAQPELSRGTITRVFTLMSSAVSQGGDSLEEFARVSGVSADQFRSSWGTADFANVFQGFLSGLSSEGQNATNTLSDLGITSVRDVPLLLRLAGAGDVVQKAFSNSAEGFADTSTLTEQYGIVAETTAAKIQILVNSFKGIVDAVGSQTLGPIAGFLDILNSIAGAILNLARTPIGQWSFTAAAAVGVLVGAIATLRAMQALSIASLLAMKVAQDSLGASAIKSGNSIRGLAGIMTQMAVGTARATAMQEAYSAALSQGATKTQAMGAALKASTGAATAAAGAFRVVGSALAWTAALTAATWVLTSWSNAQQVAKARAEELRATLDAQTGAITELTRANVAQTLEQEGFLAAAQRIGLSMDTVTDAALGQKSAMEEVKAAIAAAYAEVDSVSNEDYSADTLKMSEAATLLNRGLGAQVTALEESKASFDRVKEATGDAGNATADAASDTDLYTTSLTDLINLQYGAVDSTVSMQNALYGLGSALYENGTSFDAYSVGGRANLQALQSVVSAMAQAAGEDSAALAANLAGLMQSLAAYGVDTVNQLGYVQAMIAQLTGGKGVTTNLQAVENAALKAGNGLGQGYSAGAFKANKASRAAGSGAKKAAEEIRTLTDYVNDLQKVFSDAFDFRFGLEQSLDSTAEAFAKFGEYTDDAAQAVADARQNIDELHATLLGLASDRDILEYQLTVAMEYGDTLRANDILAELAENAVDTSKAQADLADENTSLGKAQEKLSKNLDGTTAGSREQREMVLDLTESYQKQILALANTGMSQSQLSAEAARLRQQFVQQLTQMGYNRAEVDRYAEAFDDLSFAIANVPRNLTVTTTADTSPAQRAIDEFLAKNRNAAIGTNLEMPSGADAYGAGRVAGAAYGQGWNEEVGKKRQLRVVVDLNIPGGKKYTTDGINYFASTGGHVPEYHATGGVHGMHPGKAKGTDTTPAWLTPGEFVQQKSAVEYYGLPFMNAINNMQMPRYLASGGSSATSTSGASAPRSMMVELSPTDRALLQAAGNVTLTIDGRVIANTVNGSNAASARRAAN